MNFNLRKIGFCSQIPDINVKNKNSLLLKYSEEVDTFEKTLSSDNKKVVKRGKFNSFINKIIGYNIDCSDGNDDGKLSKKDAIQSFLRGCANTITNLIDTIIEKPLTTTIGLLVPVGLSAMAVSAGIISAPMLAFCGGIIGLGFGAFSIINGIISYKNADNDYDAKLGFERIGEGTLTSVLSAFSVKKGCSELKKITEIADSAKKFSTVSKKYAEETHENILKAKKALDSVDEKHSTIKIIENDVRANLNDNISMAKDSSLDISHELSIQESGYIQIKDSAEISADILKRAKDSYSAAEQKAEIVFDAAKRIDDSCVSIRKSSTVKQALKRKETIVQDVNSLKNDALQVSQHADDILSCSDEINDIEKIVQTELKRISTTENSLKTKFDSYFKKILPPEDDRVLGFDASNVFDREDIRTHLLSRSSLCDSDYIVKSIDPLDDGAQLPKDSKYYEIGVKKINQRDNREIYIFDNLKQAPDNNGVRGKTPLSGNIKALRWKLKKAQEAGIERVIDLRADGECSSSARRLLDEMGIEYVNFPIDDEQWSLSSLNSITEYIKTINKGDFYVGCANGQARTDIAIAINYVFNPKAKNIPYLYYGSDSSTRVSVKRNLSMIFDLIKNNKDIVIEWGWDNYMSFDTEFHRRFQCLIASLKNRQKI